jgi:acetolactate synthase I/II/III large subunit
VLTVIFNNSRYGAVRKATLSMFKDGAAGEADGRFFADLDPAPPMTRSCAPTAATPSEWNGPTSYPWRSPARATRSRRTADKRW